MKRTFAAFLALATSAAIADGLPLKDGRYPGRVLQFELTEPQKARIERFRTCHLDQAAMMNWYTPYVFELTEAQAARVRKTVGFVPSRFLVYETYRGHNDAGPHWNLALRISDDEIEIPIKLLLSDRKALQAHQTQGWKQENPCFTELSPR